MLDTIFEKVAPSPYALIKSLMADGYDFINHNSNVFASCLVKPDADEVVVVNIDPYCAKHFYNYCMDHPDNPYLPTIHEMREFEGGCIVRMERLCALDHIALDEADKALMDDAAPRFVGFIRAENDAPSCAKGDALLEKTARDILRISQIIHRETDGDTLPYCDIKADNIFLRHAANGPEFVFGDPLSPGSGGCVENVDFMENVYKRFGLPSLVETKRPASAPTLQQA